MEVWLQQGEDLLQDAEVGLLLDEDLQQDVDVRPGVGFQVAPRLCQGVEG